VDDAGKITGRRVLIVEDEYLIAIDLVATLESLGFEVVGLAGSVAEALTLLESNGDRLDAAVLDINLGYERSYPVADRLRAQGVPFVFTTGYDVGVVPDSYSEVPRYEKPVDERQLVRCLSELRQGKR
jgi:CheY-like chemotaxis protein